MFTRRSKVAFIFALATVLYSVAMVVLWNRGQSALTELFETDPFLAGLGSVAGGVVSIALLPHFLSALMGTVVSVIGFFTKNDGLLLAGVILFAFALSMFFLSAVVLLPIVVLGFFGYSNQRRLLRQ